MVGAAWAELDIAGALHPLDRDVVRSTEAARSLVIELFVGAAHARDLYNACARLGGLMAEAGASPSLVAFTIDNAAQALDAANAGHDPARVAPARASLVEGYVAAVRDADRLASLAAWDYPVVPVDATTVAIACGRPADAESLAAWAGRIAGRLSKKSVKRVLVSGDDAAQKELAAALELVGITVATPRSPAAEARSWFTLPWTKKR